MKPHLVVALIYNQLCTFEFGCAVEVFALKRPELGVNWYEFATYAVDEGEITAAGGIRIVPTAGSAQLEDADTIIVPGWRGVDAEVPADLIAGLQAAHARGARICSICTGAFVLAAAGLLEGRHATTHWRYTDLLASMYPQIILQPDELYVDQGQIVTAAGSAAGLDMMLHLVRKDHGARIANMVAQRLVIPPHRRSIAICVPSAGVIDRGAYCQADGLATQQPSTSAQYQGHGESGCAESPHVAPSLHGKHGPDAYRMATGRAHRVHQGFARIINAAAGRDRRADRLRIRRIAASTFSQPRWHKSRPLPQAICQTLIGGPQEYPSGRRRINRAQARVI
jgi:putative intracellular protease/amidase